MGKKMGGYEAVVRVCAGLRRCRCSQSVALRELAAVLDEPDSRGDLEGALAAWWAFIMAEDDESDWVVLTATGRRVVLKGSEAAVPVVPDARALARADSRAREGVRLGTDERRSAALALASVVGEVSSGDLVRRWPTISQESWRLTLRELGGAGALRPLGVCSGRIYRLTVPG